MALAALGISLVLCYAGGCAIVTQRGYAAMTLRREIEDLRAENALLRYQINLSLSTPQVEVAATRLGLRPADPVEEVDYILYPGSEQQTEVAASDPAKEQLGVRSTLAGLAARVADSVGARAEASTVEDHRR